MGPCFCDGSLDEDTVISFLGLLGIVRESKESVLSKEHLKGVVNSVEPCISNREVSLGFLELFSQNTHESSNHSNHSLLYFYFTIKNV